MNFSSPERLDTSNKGTKDTFGKEDIWALGCIAYYLSTFRFPYDDTDSAKVIMKILEGEHKPLTEYGKSLELSNLVDSMLQKSPHDRPSIIEILNTSKII